MTAEFPHPEDVAAFVAERLGVKCDDLLNISLEPFTSYRHVAIEVCKRVLMFSNEDVAKSFGITRNGVMKARSRMKKKPHLVQMADLLTQQWNALHPDTWPLT